MTDIASLVVPTLRWDPTYGFDYLRDAIDEALELGVGGFLIAGGPATAVAALATELHVRSHIPLLLAADVERGVGQQFESCTGLPPFAAFGALCGWRVAMAGTAEGAAALDVGRGHVRRAARITAREMRRLGLNWALAPVCDRDIAPGNPIVGTRAAGADPELIGALVAEWIDACQAEGILACAKHYPGHGGADGDSHRGLPSVMAGAESLWRLDLAPFRAAIDAGVASMMTAHVAYPALDASGVPATVSAPILGALLRETLEFDGLLVSDALEMDGVLAAGVESDVAVRAIAAGCDVLLAPMDVAGVVRALERAVQHGQLAPERIVEAVERRGRWAEWGQPRPGREASLDDVIWARQAADQSITLLKGRFPRIGEAVEVIMIDDDAGGPWHVPSRQTFVDTLRMVEVEASVVAEPSAGTRMPVIVAAYADVVAWKGTAGFSDANRAAIAAVIAQAHEQKRESLLVLFSHPRHAADFADTPNVCCAWGGEPSMQAAAARVLVRGDAR